MRKVTSDGSTASYYELPEGAKELQHLISYRNMNGQLAEIFRACYRYGIVSHSDQLRDAKKMVFYAMAEVERLEKWALLEAYAVDDAFDEPRMDAIGQNGNDGLHYTEDMTDPRNWRAGDWVECVDDGGLEDLCTGRMYRLVALIDGPNQTHIEVCGAESWPMASRFRFHARPDADGWIKWEGGECPVGGDVKVDLKSSDGREATGDADDYGWSNHGVPSDIAYYRPHLTTKQDKG